MEKAAAREERITELESRLAEKNQRIAELERQNRSLFDDTTRVNARSIFYEERVKKKGQRIADLEAQIRNISEDQKRLVATLQLVYQKRCLGDDTIGWAELDNELLETLHEVMGDVWVKA